MHSTASRSDTALDSLNFLWLEITGKCNLTCSHCYADSGPMGDLYGSMAYEDWVRVLDQAASLGCRRVQFIGGEPTMHPRLHDMVDHANHRHYEMIEVFTNATRLSQELLGCFQRNQVHVATSFYSEEPEVHDRVTQVSGSWERTVDGIRRVVRAGLPIRVGIIETESNAGHAPQALEFLNRLGVQKVGVDRQRGVGRGALIELGSQEERYDQLCGQCWKGKLCVAPSGACFPCVFSRATPLGDVRGGLVDIITGERLLSFRREFRRYASDRNAGANTSCGPNTCGPNTCNPYTGCQPRGTCFPDCRPL